MNGNSSRRNFLAAGLALPAAASAFTPTPSPQQAPPAKAPSRGPVLKYKELGKTGLRVTTVGFGVMLTSDASVVARAVDMGINFFDTARVYMGGQNERMLGAALGAKRKNVFISTKSGVRNKAGALAELETSLKELNSDYTDIWYLHGPGKPSDISDELVEALHTAKQQGKARFIGLSTHDLPAIVDKIIELKLDVVQPQYNFAQDASWGVAIEKLGKAGVGVVAMKAMARVGMPGRGQQAPLPPNFAPAALRWLIRNPAIATTVPSMTDMDQLDQNITAMAADYSETDAKILAARTAEIGPYYCRVCGQCAGQCPKGLFPSEMVRFVMYADGYGQFGLGRESFQQMSAERQQVRCSDCDSCSVHCPNGINVAERLSRAQELFA
jgi:uncharacterized protein